MTTSTSHRHIKKRLIKTVGAHTPCSCGYMQGGELYFYIKDYQGNVRVVLNQANQPVEINSYYPYGGLMAATTTEGTQPYKYSSKELDRENGLDWYDFHARQSLYYCRQNIKRKTASSSYKCSECVSSSHSIRLLRSLHSIPSPDSSALQEDFPDPVAF